MSDNLPDLPLDICREILLRLPAESLFRFRTVCKRWRTVIDDPSFARAHQLSSSHKLLIKNDTTWSPPSDDHLYTFDLDAVNTFDGDQEISGSSLDLTYMGSSLRLRYLPVSACNGLILVRTETSLEIWNPSTHERIQLPRVDNICPGPVFVGLGYDYAAQDFKAVAIDRQQTHVFSLRSDAWRTIGECLFGGIDYSWPAEDHGLSLCGALHWFLDDEIIALDLGTEKHRHIQLNALQKTLYNEYIDVLGGCLAVSGISASRFDVWVMKDYGTDDESWTKLLSINMDRVHHADNYRPVAYMKDKNQVFLSDDVGSGFFLFDVESDSMKRVRINGLTGNLQAQIIPQTIFRLRDHCGGSRIIPLRPPSNKSFTINISS